MEAKEADRSSSGLPHAGAGDVKPAQPPSSGKNEVCLYTLFCGFHNSGVYYWE